MSGQLVVRGAREHNLKNIDLSLPRDRLVVITGPSGSGKSSLAFDTIFAEGQRRYVESLSAYARRFVGQLPRPDVDSIEGLSPAISVRQRPPSDNPRSTVGTATEIYDYLRLLFARVGQPHCPKCDRPITCFTVQQIVDRVLALPEGTRFSVQAPVLSRSRGDPAQKLDELRRQGFVRVTIDGQAFSLDEIPGNDLKRCHDLDVLVDRLSVKPGVRQRLTEAVELALNVANDVVRIAPAGLASMTMSAKLACIPCGEVVPELSPRSFSFNSPAGACPDCSGLGVQLHFDPALIVPDPTLSLQDGAIAPWGPANGIAYRRMLKRLITAYGVDAAVPWQSLDERLRNRILHGDVQQSGRGGHPGVIAELSRRGRRHELGQAGLEGRDDAPAALHACARTEVCRACAGARLRPEALHVRVAGKSIADLAGANLAEALQSLASIELGPRAAAMAQQPLDAVITRLRLLVDLGLSYLSLDRPTATLSSGEAERSRLVTQLGSGLVGVLYVLDEPSIGLHARDHARLLQALANLRDRGNTVLVVEHDEDTILAADWIADMGPGAGRQGGRLVAAGTPDQIAHDPQSPTGQYLAGRKRVDCIAQEERRHKGWLTIDNASIHNLKEPRVKLPLGALCCVTGVSGSGKSSLVMDTLLPLARERLHNARAAPGGAVIRGLEGLDRVVHVDQRPIGRTPRSNPATYTGVLTALREVFAALPEARARGYTPGRFSFNAKGGRCEACQGDGTLRVEMHFLPDVYVRCEQCSGLRYNRETLEIQYRGHSIADVLSLTADDALQLLAAFTPIRDRLAGLRRVGLGYLELGQSARTLSGGEAQRLKLAKELQRRASGRALYLLDEPTTGLHFSDVAVLLSVLRELVSAGNTVVVVEHHLDLIAAADYIVDLGPEGGGQGGRVVASGTPDDLMRAPSSHTGRYLRAHESRVRRQPAFAKAIAEHDAGGEPSPGS
ncbi:MAG: excinuclease ABC subunit UvrA [Proteobacteria bacterium]|nr:excinuclease ABC subunit UvrA [Pseudomonadota bacterium]